MRRLESLRAEDRDFLFREHTSIHYKVSHVPVEIRRILVIQYMIMNEYNMPVLTQTSGLAIPVSPQYFNPFTPTE